MTQDWEEIFPKFVDGIPCVYIMETPVMVLIPYANGPFIEVQCACTSTYHEFIRGICLPLSECMRLAPLLEALHPGRGGNLISEEEADKID